MSVDILTVDDNPNNLRSLDALLADTGANVVHAASGDEALRRLLAQEFALILLDVQMPNLDGYETAALIRSRDRTRHTPIIFITAFNRSEANVLRGYSLGAVDFLFKPIVPEVLRSKVSFFLELHRKTKETQRQAELLREAEKRQYEMERERKIAEALHLKNQELSRTIEEKEKAQRDLRRSNERLELLANTANQLLLEHNPQHLVGEIYQRLAGHLGLDSFFQYLMDEPTEELKLTSHAGISPELAIVLDRCKLGHGVIGRAALEQSRIIDDERSGPGLNEKDPLLIAGLSSVACFPLLDKRRLLGVLALGTRKPRAFLDEELAVMQTLCNQVAVALERARLIAELKESDRRKDEFLAMLGHELRNPLAPIRNSLEVLRLRTERDELLDRAIGAAERQVRHMTRLVDDLLDVSRITRGKVELRRELVDLNTIVEQAVHASEPILQQREHTLAVTLPDKPVILDVDPSRLAQVFANLLQNAAKYTDPGGRIRFSAERARNELVVRVIDNGIGLRPAMLNRIFDLFVQEDPSSDRAQGGLGLGLTLVRSLVEMHGGTVKAQSEGLGKGSEFVVRLPLPREQPMSTKPETPPNGTRKADLRSLNILLVEDNPDIRMTMRDLLELHGHKVSEAADGVRAVEMVLAEKPNVALVDIGLPGLDGYRVAEMVRAAAGTADTRLIALTGYGAEEARRKALDSGFDAHLVKPVSAEDLWGLLKRLC